MFLLKQHISLPCRMLRDVAMFCTARLCKISATWEWRWWHLDSAPLSLLNDSQKILSEKTRKKHEKFMDRHREIDAQKGQTVKPVAKYKLSSLHFRFLLIANWGICSQPRGTWRPVETENRILVWERTRRCPSMAWAHIQVLLSRIKSDSSKLHGTSILHSETCWNIPACWDRCFLFWQGDSLCNSRGIRPMACGWRSANLRQSL